MLSDAVSAQDLSYWLAIYNQHNGGGEDAACDGGGAYQAHRVVVPRLYIHGGVRVEDKGSHPPRTFHRLRHQTWRVFETWRGSQDEIEGDQVRLAQTRRPSITFVQTFRLKDKGKMVIAVLNVLILAIVRSWHMCVTKLRYAHILFQDLHHSDQLNVITLSTDDALGRLQHLLSSTNIGATDL